MTNTIDLKKTITTLTITILLISTIAFIGIPIANAQPTIGLVPAFGPVGEEVTVSGDATKGGEVRIYWETIADANLLATKWAIGGTYSVEIDVPEDVSGLHDVIAYDVSAHLVELATFDIISEISISTTKGVPGDLVTVTGTGFAATSDVDVFFETPPVLLIEQYGALGSTAEWSTDPVTDAPKGDVVKLVGVDDGSEAAAGVYISDGPTLDGDNAITITNLGFSYYGGTDVTNVPDFALRFEAPTCIDPDDDTSMYRGHVDVGFTGLGSASHGSWVDVSFTGAEEVVVFGNKPLTGEAFSKFGLTWAGVLAYLKSAAPGDPELTGLDEWVLTRVSPQVGWTVIGTYYVDDVAVEGTTYDLEAPVGEAVTGALGSFEVDITIPVVTLTTIPYKVTAIDEDGNSAADSTLVVDYYVTVLPTRGPPGINVDVSGRIGADKPVEVKFGKDSSWLTAFTTTSDADGYFSGEYTLPSLLEETTYKFKAIWDSEERTADFVVGATPTITLDPDEDYAGETVTVTGSHFCSEVNITIYFDTTVVNETATDDAGGFECTFTVPDVAADIYKVTAEDEYGASAEAYFTVKALPVIVIRTRATEYMPGDTVTFYLNSTLKLGIAIEIKDPTDYLVTTINIAKEDWTKVGDYYIVTYGEASFDLPSDAMLGIWNWTATYTPIEEEVTDTGVFTVIEEVVAPQLNIAYTPETVYQYDIVTVNVTVEGTPIAGASVTIVDPDGVSLDRTTTAAGTCTFTADEVGGWSVLASKSSYTDAEPETITVLEKPAVTEYPIELTEGWNLVSLPLIPDNSTIEAVLADVMENVTVVYAYNAATEEWSIYNPAAPEVSSLTIMVDGKGYWIKMSASATLIVHGTEMPEDPTDPLPEYPVVEGWNLIGYKETYSRKVSEYLSGVEYSTVYGYWDGAYHRLSADDLMEPGRAYWIAVTAEGTIYP